MRFKTQGVCSREISFEVKDNKLTNVQFVGGCSGNTQGLSRLIEEIGRASCRERVY